MALITGAVKGTQDTLPQDSGKIRFVEQTIADIAANYGFREIRTPVFEHTELFNRSVGDTTDVVQKEMYTFEDKGGRSVTLRPEGTAGVVRAFIEHGLFNDALPQKMYYFTSAYRYEKPQAGRLREFHQFGVECFGPEGPAADAEIIALASEIFGFLGVEGLELRINSIGCPTCRAEYQKALKEYFLSNIDELCDTCKDRLDRNPMRILDCKSPVCSEIAKDAPKTLDYLCDDCKAHFEGLKKYLEAMHIPYRVDPTIVRGLDYYTRTVFEFITADIGAQGTVCGGGRYDGLCEELGGAHIPALGFGLGLERLMLLLEAQKIELPEDMRPDIYLAPVGEAATVFSAGLANELRQNGIFALFDISARGIKAQMKYANKIGAHYVVVIGDDELNSGKAKLKNMETGDETETDLKNLAEDFGEIAIKDSIAKFDMGDDLADVDMSAIDFNALFGGKD